MALIPTSAPASFHAGDTVRWLVDAPDYLPADGWAIHVNLTNALETTTVLSADNGDGRHLVTITAAASTVITPGDYNLVAAAQDGTDRFPVTADQITVRPNLTAAADGRTHVKKTLDALEAWVESSNPGVAEYQIAGRTMKYIPIAELLALQSKYRQLYKNELNADRLSSGKRPRRRLLTRMQG